MSWIRRVSTLLLGLMLLVVVGVLLGLQLGQRRAARTVSVEVKAVALRADAQAIERGRYLFSSRGCAECHGADGAGRTLVDDGKGTHLAGHNITRGNPALAAYSDTDWVRSIRHGVNPAGRPLRLMPSQDFARMSDADLGALVAYVRQLPAKEGHLRPMIELPLPARVLYGFGGMPEAYELINHSLPPTASVSETPTAAYGEYVAQGCKGCHGPKLEGGRIPGSPPGWPPAARLAAGADSAMARYPDLASFSTMLKTGKRPDGKPIAVMPFGALSQVNATEAEALYRYLRRLAGLPG